MAAVVRAGLFSIWLLVVIFNFSFSIGLQFRADVFQISQQRQALFVGRNNVRTYIHILCGLLAATSCSDDRSAESFRSYSKLPAPPTNFGVVIAYNEQASEVTAVIMNKEVYQLLRDAIVPKGHFKNSEKLKLLNLTTAQINKNQELRSLSKYCSWQDSDEFFEHVDTGVYIFDCAQLQNTVCISVAEDLDTFSTDDKVENWNRLQEKYGKFGLHYFSIPLFNRRQTKAIMITGGWGGSSGSKELVILTKQNGHWKIEHEVRLEII